MRLESVLSPNRSLLKVRFSTAGQTSPRCLDWDMAQSTPAKSESKSKSRVTAAKTTKKSPAKKGAKKR